MGWRLPEVVKEKSNLAESGDKLDPFSICNVSSLVSLRKSAVLYSERDAAENVYVVRRGLCFSFRYDTEGRRQIIDLAFPGDFVGLEALTQDRYVCGLSALSQAELVAYPVNDFTRECYAEPALSRALVECIAREQAILTKRLVGVTHSSASRRIAHFLLEVRVRAMVARKFYPLAHEKPSGRTTSIATGRRATDENFRLKLPQAIIADTLGLSIVHVSRTLSKLKDDGLIDYCSAGLRFCNLEGLKSVAMWEGLEPWFETA